ncbi:MAG: type II secretion system protein [Sedimentisphaerales bacterium]|nr:type II secretion system protein [Sedimentisphaerales bacterium]
MASPKYKRLWGGFTLVEMLVTMGIILTLAGIMLPAINGARNCARGTLCQNNLKQVGLGFTDFCFDHKDRYMPSIATIGGRDERWGWQPPNMMTSSHEDTLYPLRRNKRSLSAYIRNDYIENVRFLYCPNTPEMNPYLKEMWKAGDDWDNPETEGRHLDPFFGTYNFYQNYTGYLGAYRTFKGPTRLADRNRQSKIVAGDYFGYGFDGAENCFVSCEKFYSNSGILKRIPNTSDFWYHLNNDDGTIQLSSIKIKLNYVLTDGSIHTYGAGQSIAMQVSKSADGTDPYMRYSENENNQGAPLYGYLFLPEGLGR